jgi:hypothetical protein
MTQPAAGAGPLSPPGGAAPASPAPHGGAGAPAPNAQGQPADAGAGSSDASPGGTAPEQPEDYAVGSGDAAAEATSRHGQGSLRNEYLREAERLAIEGDAVGRDKNIFLVGGKQRARLRLLSPRQMEPVRHAFIAPDSLGEIRTAFEKSRAVILRGPAGCGKQAIAIRMLVDLSRGPVFHLDSAVDLARLAEWIETDLKGRDRIEQGAGFLLNQPVSFAGLYGSVLQGLDEVLERADARLVLTIGSDVPVPDHDLFDYIVDYASTPKYLDIVTSHLGLRLTRELADRLLSRADVQEAIARQLENCASCKLAADLAEAIAYEFDIADDETSFDIGRIEAWKSQRGAEDFDIWFAALGDTRSRSFAIALAVLNGLPYDAVAKAARKLYRRFEQPPYMVMASADDVQPEGLRPFRTSRREWLHKLGARTKEVEVRGPYGHSPAAAVEYRDPDYADKVIQRAWSDFEVQDVLLAWLGELAEDASEQVRIFAGIALGHLATGSFDTLSSSVLAPWATSKRRAHREAVAYALRVVASDLRLRENVGQLISGWYANRGNPFAQATAARSYGVAYGMFDPAAAFEALYRLTAVDDIRVATAIGDSIADLVVTGSDDLICSILPKLAASVREQGRSGAVQLVFLILADGLVARVQEPGEEAGPVAWPLLLHLMTRLTEVRTAIIMLWQYVLNEALFHEEAEQVMARWAGAAERDPGVREAFLRLARAIGRGDERCQMILERYCALWTSTDNLRPLPVVSAALQTVLTATREAR